MAELSISHDNIHGGCHIHKRWLNLQLPTNMHMTLLIEIIVIGTILLQSLSSMYN